MHTRDAIIVLLAQKEWSLYGLFVWTGAHEPAKPAKERTSASYRKINCAVAGTKKLPKMVLTARPQRLLCQPQCQHGRRGLFFDVTIHVT